MPLPPDVKKAVREEIISFCKLAEQYESRWHYTQNRPFHGFGSAPQTFHYNDCSGYASLIFYWASKHVRHGAMNDPLDYHYSGYGNTQTALAYLHPHHAPVDKYRVGDMAIYGTASDTKHMTVCRKNGTGGSSIWSSFGQESGSADGGASLPLRSRGRVQTSCAAVRIPDWWQFTLLGLAAWRVFQLISADDILDRPRRYVTARLSEQWQDFISCPYCIGFWIALAWWGAWEKWPHGAVVVSAPLALSAGVIAGARMLSSD